jgi:hypothetical protein
MAEEHTYGMLEHPQLMNYEHTSDLATQCLGVSNIRDTHRSWTWRFGGLGLGSDCQDWPHTMVKLSWR